jgi:BirA family biotin operon repressor/biotin-[acetyl-CoA-carboxylase] ligase
LLGGNYQSQVNVQGRGIEMEIEKVLHILQDGRFHSGEVIGKELGISRAAVWKVLQKAKEESGIAIHRVPGKGYRLANPLSLLDSSRLLPSLAELSWALSLRSQIDSTNAEALRLMAGRSRQPLVVLAEAQSNGRGRRGRHWVSPYGENLYFTLGCSVAEGFAQLAGLSLVVGIATLRALESEGLANGGLKWPNDIYSHGKKIAGILVEIAGDPADLCQVAIGIGVNVNMTESASSIDQEWTSLRLQLGRFVDRSALAIQLAQQLQRYLQRFLDRGFHAFKDEWEQAHLWQGEECLLSTPLTSIEGVVLGVDGQGGIRLRVDGREQVFCGGELSLRRIE